MYLRVQIFVLIKAQEAKMFDAPQMNEISLPVARMCLILLPVALSSYSPSRHTELLTVVYS